MPVVGADEAGKGPVLGPLVVAAVSLEEGDVRGDYRDSKGLSPGKRLELAERIEEEGVVSTAVSGPGEIDSRGIDEVLKEGFVEVLSSLEFDLAYADAADVDAGRFERFLRGRTGYDVRAEHRADKNRPVVAAASIVAKVERDRRMGKIAEVYGEVGSGYPSDRRTIRFLKGFVEENGVLPECARSSWSTSRRILAEEVQMGIGQF